VSAARGAALLVLALVAASGCGAPAARSPQTPPNILVVLVDTLRADRLSLYGYERETSPNLDRFARERAVVFDHAWANAGCTYPSANSILTGRWPQRFTEDRDARDFTIHPETPTLAERLRANGYSTAAVSASRVVRATPSKINVIGGFDRGFERFDERCELLGADCVNERAFAELDRLEEPFLLDLHYLDPHSPYAPPPGFPRRWSEASKASARRWARRGNPWRVEQRVHEGATRYRIGPSDLRQLSDLYDEEIRYFDARFDELLDALERRQLASRTLIVLLADHGEELYDNGSWGHCRGRLWETLLETPLVFAVPGRPTGRRSTPVSNIDVMPTLLDFAGVADPAAGLDGRSLRPLLEQTAPKPESRPLFATQGWMRVARDRGLKVRFDLRSGGVEFRRPRIGEPEVASPGREGSELLVALEGWLADQERATPDESVRRAEELESELKALGYL